MKKFLTCVLIAMVALSSVFAQGAKEPVDDKTIDNLIVYYVPSRDPEEIVTVTAPLKELLKAELLKEGYTVNNVDIQVGTTYEAVGNALAAGTADIGLIPANTYLTYDDGCDVILTATRDGLSIDDDSAKVWNDEAPTAKDPSSLAVGYRALMIAGPSAKGQELIAKVNAGEELTWDDLNSANWAIRNTTSSAGFVYPTLWLMDHYDGKRVTDLAHTVIADSYGSAFARLASEQIDILCCYADARLDNEANWTEKFGRSASIWDETGVVGVTPMIYNDTVSVSKVSEKMTPEFIEAVQNAFMRLNETEEGRAVIAVYSHTGYQKAVSSDYDNERKAQQILRENN